MSVVLCVQNFVWNPLSLQHFAQFLTAVNRNSTNQNWLTSLICRLDSLYNCTEFTRNRRVNYIWLINSNHRQVCRNCNNIQVINLVKLGLLGLGRTSHTTEFLVHFEEVLESDSSNSQQFVLDLQPLFCLNSLMQTVTISTPLHNTTCELVNNQNLAITNDIVALGFHNKVRSQSVQDVLVKLHVICITQTLNAVKTLCLVRTFFCKVNSLFLLINSVIFITL